MEIHEIFRAPVFRRGPDKDGFSLGKRGNLAEVEIAMLFVLHLNILFFRCLGMNGGASAVQSFQALGTAYHSLRLVL